MGRPFQSRSGPQGRSESERAVRRSRPQPRLLWRAVSRAARGHSASQDLAETEEGRQVLIPVQNAVDDPVRLTHDLTGNPHPGIQKFVSADTSILRTGDQPVPRRDRTRHGPLCQSARRGLSPRGLRPRHTQPAPSSLEANRLELPVRQQPRLFLSHWLQRPAPAQRRYLPLRRTQETPVSVTTSQTKGRTRSRNSMTD